MTVEAVQRAPYRLVHASEGVGFKTADRIAERWEEWKRAAGMRGHPVCSGIGR
jgi:hypothetical protein